MEAEYVEKSEDSLFWQLHFQVPGVSISRERTSLKINMEPEKSPNWKGQSSGTKPTLLGWKC